MPLFLVRLLLSLTLLVSVMPSAFAGEGGELSAQGASLAGSAALSVIAVPVLVTAGASVAVGDIVRLTGEAGESLGDLTLSALDSGLSGGDYSTNSRKTTYNQNFTQTVIINNTVKEIPLVVRPNYLQLNEKIGK